MFAYTQVTKGTIRMLKCSWEKQGRSDLIWVTDAKILHFQQSFHIDVTDPKTAMMFQQRKDPAEAGLLVRGNCFVVVSRAGHRL